MFDVLFFALFAINLGWDLDAHAGAFHPEVGSPHYILEQNSSESPSMEFAIWEIRPSERSHNPLSGSRKIAQGTGRLIRSFGLSGYSSHTEYINAGTPWVLDQRGVLAYFDGTQWQEAPGRYSALTQQAGAILYAIGRDRHIEEIQGPSRRMVPIPKSPSSLDVKEVHMSANGLALEILDQSGALLRWDFAGNKWSTYPLPNLPQNRITLWQIESEFTWGVTADKIVLQNGTQIQSAEIEPGARIQVLQAHRDALIARVGENLWKFTPSVFGARLSTQILAQGLYQSDLRAYGILAGLHKEILSVRPFEFDRAALRRWDIAVADYQVSATRASIHEGADFLSHRQLLPASFRPIISAISKDDRHRSPVGASFRSFMNGQDDRPKTKVSDSSVCSELLWPHMD